MKARLARLFYPYGAKRRVLRGPARGMRFIVESGIGVSFALGTNAAAPRFFQRHVRRGMTVYDVGANKGQMALLFATLVGPAGRVVALEPVPSEFSSLERNLRLNRVDTIVRALRVAISDRECDLSFLCDAVNPTQGKLADVEPTYQVPGAQAITVKARPLDRLLEAERPPDVLKIDVEGAAASVLRGARRILDDVGPGVYLELHGPEEQAGVRNELLTRGYVAETLDGRTVEDPTRGWYSPLWCHRDSHIMVAQE